MPDLEHGTVHLWKASFASLDLRDVGDDRTLLSPDELVRAGRLRIDGDGNRFILRRAFLRRVLAVYAGRRPGDLSFDYGDMGKPALRDCGEGIEFNQADTQRWTVVAVSPIAVGVDIEVVRPSVDIRTLASEVFTERERDELASVPDDQRLHAFFNGWTRKEAVIKALGKGLAFPLQEIDVSLAPGAPAVLNRLGIQANPDWSMHVFALDKDTIGAIAAAEPRTRVLGMSEEGTRNNH